jgi:hypothetical protein
MPTLLEAALDAEARGLVGHPGVHQIEAPGDQVAALPIPAGHTGADPQLVGTGAGPQPRHRHRADQRVDRIGLRRPQRPGRPDLPPPTVISASGGWHWYCQEAELGNVGHLAPGLDIRGAGGIVVTAPSVHPNGRLYERLTDRLAVVPDDMVTMMQARAEEDAARRGEPGVEAGATLTVADVVGVLQNVRPYQGGYLVLPGA